MLLSNDWNILLDPKFYKFVFCYKNNEQMQSNRMF